MPMLMIRLLEEQLRALRVDGPSSIIELDEGTPPWRTFPGVRPNDRVYVDPIGVADGVVLRCIGTVLELDAHQRRGGALLLEYPDGSLRELRISLTQDGEPIPRTLTDKNRRFARQSRYRGRGRSDPKP